MQFEGKVIDISKNREYKEYDTCIPVVLINDKEVYRFESNQVKLRESYLKL